ncbi:MAG TPA: ferredoxin [Firmicutes bacterium]|nr:ferredoxin [Bacillota bacterium]
MNASVDPDLCIACGLCVSTCPEVFDWDDDGKASAKMEEVPAESEVSAEEAADGCPTDAITLE